MRSGVGLNSGRDFITEWVEFVVGSRPCSEGFVFLRVRKFFSLGKNQHSKC